ncbi:hypothetical protein EAD98_23290 [Micromonospora sp. CV4]|nr:hypothetical protein EAD98_23290 [Micromonospora sp. CV4]
MQNRPDRTIRAARHAVARMLDPRVGDIGVSGSARCRDIADTVSITSTDPGQRPGGSAYPT